MLVPLYSFSWRERLLAPAAGLFSLPDADPRQLAMLGINPPTAALLLDESIDLRPGDWVAQNAANSGVGRSVIAMARTRGLKTINIVRGRSSFPSSKSSAVTSWPLISLGHSTRFGQGSAAPGCRSALTASQAKQPRP